jgi:hypothetical protein
MIDKGICREIDRASQLSATDIISAYYIYEYIIAKYDGIDAVEPAKAAYRELKKDNRLKVLLLASAKYPRID